MMFARDSQASAKDPSKNSERPGAFCPQGSCLEWLAHHSKGTAFTVTTLLDFSRRSVHRRQPNLQRSPNCCSEGPPGRNPIQTACQPPRYREDQAKGTNVSVLEEPEH